VILETFVKNRRKERIKERRKKKKREVPLCRSIRAFPNRIDLSRDRGDRGTQKLA